jgi:hypothetical protein
LRVVMSPEAETSTNKGDRTSSKAYWSRSLTEVAQESSIFWNSRISGLSEVVTLTGVGVTAGAGAWAIATQEIRRRAEKQAKKRVIRSMNSHLNSLSWLVISFESEQHNALPTKNCQLT